jgi:hypothetical protein
MLGIELSNLLKDQIEDDNYNADGYVTLQNVIIALSRTLHVSHK